MIEPINRDYFPTPTISRFMKSKAFHRGIMGPRGSGKSSGCINELMRRLMAQRPGPTGVRQSKMAIVRNTYRELEDTTLQTWLQWFPEEYFGRFNHSTMTHEILIPRKDGTVEAEVIFRALDKPKDIKKLLSMELTGAYINEAREVPFGLIGGLDDAVGRFPRVEDGGCTWRGVIMDTNAPDDDHWWYQMAEVEDLDPKYWQFFRQPGGLIEKDGQFYNNPEAENIDNLEPEYYYTRAQGQKPQHIRIYYCNQYGFISDGKPVHEEFVDATHMSPIELEFIKGSPIYVGIDFGLTPAALFGQRLKTNGRWLVIDELTTEHMGISRFADELKPILNRLTNDGFTLDIYGDPAGSQEAQTDERTPFQILEAKGIPCKPAASNNDPILRREALYQPLSRMIDGKPGMLISPRCRKFRKGMNGGYHYKRVQVSGQERYEDKPYKNEYSHIVEAGEYMAQGAGEGSVQQISGKKQDYSALHWHPGAGRRDALRELDL